MADQNKTELTLRVTEASVRWLAGIGCKPIETEVPVAERWVADAAGVWNPTRTEAQAHKLIPPTPRWNKDAPANYQQKHAARSAAFNALPSPIAVVAEVKTSKSDFYRDDKWVREVPGNMALLAMPVGMIPENEWPQDWWVVLYHESRNEVVIARRGKIQPIDDRQKMWFCFSLAERCHARTANAMYRDLARSHRDQDNERTNLARVSRAVDAVVYLLKHPSEDIDWVMASRLRTTLPKYVKDRIVEARETFGRKSETSHA